MKLPWWKSNLALCIYNLIALIPYYFIVTSGPYRPWFVVMCSVVLFAFVATVCGIITQRAIATTPAQQKLKAVAWPARYKCSSETGTFWTDDLDFARMVIPLLGVHWIVTDTDAIEAQLDEPIEHPVRRLHFTITCPYLGDDVMYPLVSEILYRYAHLTYVDNGSRMGAVLHAGTPNEIRLTVSTVAKLNQTLSILTEKKEDPA